MGLNPWICSLLAYVVVASKHTPGSRSNFCNHMVSVGCVEMVYLPILGGGFKYFLFSPLFGEDFQFD